MHIIDFQLTVIPWGNGGNLGFQEYQNVRTERHFEPDSSLIHVQRALKPSSCIFSRRLSLFSGFAILIPSSFQSPKNTSHLPRGGRELRSLALLEAIYPTNYVCKDTPKQTVKFASLDFAPFDKVLNIWETVVLEERVKG